MAYLQQSCSAHFVLQVGVGRDDSKVPVINISRSVPAIIAPFTVRLLQERNTRLASLFVAMCFFEQSRVFVTGGFTLVCFDVIVEIASRGQSPIIVGDGLFVCFGKGDTCLAAKRI